MTPKLLLIPLLTLTLFVGCVDSASEIDYTENQNQPYVESPSEVTDACNYQPASQDCLLQPAYNFCASTKQYDNYQERIIQGAFGFSVEVGQRARLDYCADATGEYYSPGYPDEIEVKAYYMPKYGNRITEDSFSGEVTYLGESFEMTAEITMAEQCNPCEAEFPEALEFTAEVSDQTTVFYFGSRFEVTLDEGYLKYDGCVTAPIELRSLSRDGLHFRFEYETQQQCLLGEHYYYYTYRR